MQTLILSCNTGAGHNSCAQAVQEAYHSRGEICNITDSLQFISEKASTFISNWHTRMRAAMRSQTECTAADKIYEWIYSHAK